jgi:hypothetical protein
MKHVAVFDLTYGIYAKLQMLSDQPQSILH